jgi:hypothetical protein
MKHRAAQTLLYLVAVLVGSLIGWGVTMALLLR